MKKYICDEIRNIYNIKFVYIYILRTIIIEDNRRGYLEKMQKE